MFVPHAKPSYGEEYKLLYNNKLVFNSDFIGFEFDELHLHASIKAKYDQVWKLMEEVNEDLTDKEIENYVTHIWDIPKNKQTDVGQWFSIYNKFLFYQVWL